MIFESEKLSGHLLDFAVAKSLGHAPLFQFDSVVSPDSDDSIAFDVHNFSESHEKSGPLIDVFSINTNKVSSLRWTAHIYKDSAHHAAWRTFGTTRIEAALRCLVLCVLGEKIDIPSEFVTDVISSMSYFE